MIFGVAAAETAFGTAKAPTCLPVPAEERACMRGIRSRLWRAMETRTAGSGNQGRGHEARFEAFGGLGQSV